MNGNYNSPTSFGLSRRDKMRREGQEEIDADLVYVLSEVELKALYGIHEEEEEEERRKRKKRGRPWGVRRRKVRCRK